MIAGRVLLYGRYWGRATCGAAGAGGGCLYRVFVGCGVSAAVGDGGLCFAVFSLVLLKFVSSYARGDGAYDPSCTDGVRRLGRGLCRSCTGVTAEKGGAASSSVVAPRCFNNSCIGTGGLVIVIGDEDRGKVRSMGGELKASSGMVFRSYACSLRRLGSLGTGLRMSLTGGATLQSRVK